jgi:hypothetical protein
MRQLFLSIIFISLFIQNICSQVFTMDITFHTYYVNKNPGQIVVKNKNWRDYIEYPGTGGGGYHSRYIYNLSNPKNATIVVLELDSLGNIIPDSITIEPVEVIFVSEEYFYVFNPKRELFSMFYIDDWKIPNLLIERVNGEGWFATYGGLEYKID